MKYPWLLSLPEDGEVSPRALVVLIGWWGAMPRHLNKYVELYKELQCATLCGVADDRSIMLKDDARLREYAKDGLAQVSRVLQNNHNHLPLFIHVFSNGGGFVLEQMEIDLEDPDHHFPNPSESNMSLESLASEETPLHSNTNVALIRKNLRGLVFDSCPAYPTLQTWMAALELSGVAKKSKFVLYLLKFLLLVLFGLEGIWNWIRGKNHRLVDYWNNLLTSDLCEDQAYIYSTSDSAADPEHLKEFIAARQNRPKANVSILKLDDSEHVQHYRKHPHLYTHFVHTFVTNLLQQKPSST